MVDGSAVLATMMFAFRHTGLWSDVRSTNMLDTGPRTTTSTSAPTAGTCRSVRSNHQFYAELLEKLGLDPSALPAQNDVTRWPELRAVFTDTFAKHDRDHWAEIFTGSDACVTPVLSFAEIETEPHNTERAAS